MFTVVIEKFENLRHLVHARLLSSEYHDLRNVVKEHVAADVWKTYCITDGNTASNITCFPCPAAIFFLEIPLPDEDK